MATFDSLTPAALSRIAEEEGALDLVLGFGKTRSKLLVLDAAGGVVHASDHAARSREQAGYLALDTDALQAWLCDALAGLGSLRGRLAHIIVGAHGAAFALVDDTGLVLPVPDYEFAGFDQRPQDWSQQIAAFDESLSPDLPRGLNSATQLDWLTRHHPYACNRGQWVPYVQYWACWMSGQAASEVSSRGCHTHLWHPAGRRFSALAERRGWAARFAPRRDALDILGPVRPELARAPGLPATLQVHVGVHDSNACLARYLRTSPLMTLVSSGTWTVVMAPGAVPCGLDPTCDLLGNVSVLQQPVPTGRFMGGRELSALCAGADPSLADEPTLQSLLDQGLMALPGFEAQGGPFRARCGSVVDRQGDAAEVGRLAPAERATLAALYCAQVTAWLVQRLGAAGTLVIKGPFAHNRVHASALAALLPEQPAHCSSDRIEGTARGAWQLIHWTDPRPTTPMTDAVAPFAQPTMGALQARWRSALH